MTSENFDAHCPRDNWLLVASGLRHILSMARAAFLDLRPPRSLDFFQT